jgi:hypothetical protein
VHEATPEVASVPDHAMPTGARYHRPLSGGRPAAAPVTAGGVASIRMTRVWVVVVPSLPCA